MYLFFALQIRESQIDLIINCETCQVLLYNKSE